MGLTRHVAYFFCIWYHIVVVDISVLYHQQPTVKRIGISGHSDPGSISLKVFVVIIETLWKFPLRHNCNDPIRSQIFTSHDSTAVVVFAKLWSDPMTIFGMRTTWSFFTRFRLWAHKPVWNGHLIFAYIGESSWSEFGSWQALGSDGESPDVQKK